MDDAAKLLWIERGELLATLLVAIGVLGEFVGTFAAKPIRRRLESAHRVEIARLQKDAEGLRKEAEGAKLARVQAEQHSANRDLDLKSLAPLSATLSAFKGQVAQVDVFPLTFESTFLAHQIAGMLTTAGWVVPPVNQLAAPPHDIYVPGAVILTAGVMLASTLDPQSRAARDGLWKVLMAAPDVAGVNWTDPLPDQARPRVWILVGDKPRPLRSWVK